MNEKILTEPVIYSAATKPPANNHLYAVFLKMENLVLAIVGGGERSVSLLKEVLENSPEANIRVIAIEISKEIKDLAERNKKIQLIERSFRLSDITDADIIVSTINDETINAQISKRPKNKGSLVSIMDQPELSDFLTDPVAGNIARKFSAGGEIEEIEKPSQKYWKRVATYSTGVFACMLIGYFVFSNIPLKNIYDKAFDLYRTLDASFPWLVLAGFAAQLVDGALGMGYGVTSAAILLSTGVNPSVISSSIHTAEIFSSGASGYSHYKFGNVNKKMFKIMVIPGVLGAVGGAMLLIFLGEKYSLYIKPVLAAYTLFLGCKILLSAFRKMNVPKKFKHYGPLAALGGFLDSFGGGGWGPIVTTTLITKGRSPKFVIGTVSLTEFFVTLASAFTFFTLLGVSHWQTILALILGGLVAAPIAAKLTGKLPRKASFILVGILVIFWSLKILSKLL